MVGTWIKHVGNAGNLETIVTPYSSHVLEACMWEMKLSLGCGAGRKRIRGDRAIISSTIITTYVPKIPVDRTCASMNDLSLFAIHFAGKRCF